MSRPMPSALRFLGFIVVVALVVVVFPRLTPAMSPYGSSLSDMTLAPEPFRCTHHECTRQETCRKSKFATKCTGTIGVACVTDNC